MKATATDQYKGGLGLSPSTVRIVRNALKAAFNYALDEKIIAENPVIRTKLPPARESRANSLTIDEAVAFVAVKDHFWYGVAFVFQLHTGLRPQELLALVWEDVDFEQGTLRIERACKWVAGRCVGFGPPKSKRSSRIIGLAPEHLELLRQHFEKQQKVIKNRKAKDDPYGDPKIKEWVLRERPKQTHLYAASRLIFPKPTGEVPRMEVLIGLCK
ncbi:MAG: tyrosine-type recombinase/integrase [Pyrinomonadaceae bacterium]